MTKTDNTRPAGMLAGEQQDGRRHEGEKLALTVDFTRYTSKPQGWEPAAITRRLQAAGPTNLTIEEFALAIANGCTWVGGCFEPRSDGWGKFLGMRVFALDLDNDTVVLGDDGEPLKDENNHVVKRQLMPYEDGYLTMWDAIYKFFHTFGSWPLMLYPTLRFHWDHTWQGLYSPETKMKFRLVYDLGQFITDEDKASAVVARILKAFPEADQKCSNIDRLFFGACGKVVWFERDGRHHIVSA